MDLSKYLDWIKLSPKYLLPIALLSGFLVFSNEKTLNYFGLFSFVNQFRPWISIIFLLSVALSLSDFILRLIKWAQEKYEKKQEFKHLTERLYKLTPDEKEILLGYILNNTRTQYLGINDGTVQELSHFTIIYRSSNVGDINRWSYNIQPWAFEYMKKHMNEIFTEEEIDEYKKTHKLIH